jgi:nitrogen fixation protein
MIKIALFCILTSCLVGSAYADSIQIKYSQSRKGSALDQYAIDLVKFLIEISGEKGRFIPIEDTGSQTRRQILMQKGVYDVDWFGGTTNIETLVVPIRYPILRGLLGHRVFITNKETSAILNAEIPFTELKEFKVIQGQGWGDVLILKNGGFTKVRTIADFDSLFKMIEVNRSSLFPRSIIEPYNELGERCHLNENDECTDRNLLVDDKLLLIYKLPMFIFVSPERPDLIKIFNDAFENHYEEFLVFFNNHPLIKDALKKLNNRSVYQMNGINTLSNETLKIPDKYWMDTYTKAL